MSTKMWLALRILTAVLCLCMMGLWFATQVPRNDLDQFMQMAGGRGFRIKYSVIVLMAIFLLYFWAVRPRNINQASKTKRLLFAAFFFISAFIALFGIGFLILIMYNLKPIYF